jgi:hypothetical protein
MILSPSSTNGGTIMSMPFFNFAGLYEEAAV